MMGLPPPLGTLVHVLPPFDRLSSTGGSLAARGGQARGAHIACTGLRGHINVAATYDAAWRSEQGVVVVIGVGGVVGKVR